MVDEAAAGLAYIVGKLFNYCFGWLLARLRRKIDQSPQKEFSELTAVGKIGRLFLMAAVLVTICAPLAWLIWR